MFHNRFVPTVLHLLLTLPLLSRAQPSHSARGTLKFSYGPNITRVIFDHPPLNLFDADLGADLLDFLRSIQPGSVSTLDNTNSTAPPKVVIFSSADPDIFAMHLDLNGLVDPTLGAVLTEQLYGVVELVRNTSTTVFISQINGLAMGFGNEFSVQTDMRFAGPKTRAAQVENAGGLFAGAGGQQALPRLINRGRGLRYLLAAEAVDGPTGAALGWFNEYHANETELNDAVEAVARRIALLPAYSISATKGGLVELYPDADVYQRDRDEFGRLAGLPETQAAVRKMLELGNNQSRGVFELGLPDTLLQLWE